MRPSRNPGHFDLAVVGAGILGLACARAATRRGLRVVVIDRDALALGASVRNFGFVTISGQERGPMWQRARRSREVWAEVAQAAGIPIEHSGAWLIARRPEAAAVLEEFKATEMGEDCDLYTAARARQQAPDWVGPEVTCVLHSPLELRVESRLAIPRLATWLEQAHEVTFLRSTTVTGISAPAVETTRGAIHADRIVVCPGDDFHGLYRDVLSPHALTRCKLQMLRLEGPGDRIPAALMSDLSIARYAGFAHLSSAGSLRTRIATEQPADLAHGVHLIVVQSADGSLVVGDSHEYGEAPGPFTHSSIDALILSEFERTFSRAPPPVLERWMGTYASAADRPVLVEAPHPAVRIAIVTSGAGASVGFALGEEVVASLH